MFTQEVLRYWEHLLTYLAGKILGFLPIGINIEHL